MARQIKPYVVTRCGWSKEGSRIGWGTSIAEAKQDAYGRMGIEYHKTGCRPATPLDLAEMEHEQPATNSTQEAN